MSLSIGTQLGSHEITALLGKGGMGEVYRARDKKLKREVAIKILPDEFSRNGDRVSRFQREAELLASLNHPHIAGIYELAESGGMRYLVLELVDGETLEDRLKRVRISVEEALSMAKQIAEALEAAHEKGIVHRDLKPANVKITTEGKLKVLDFGLAKAFGEPESPALSHSPTVVSASMPGAIVGTAAYMSPEQTRGHAADNRSDIFSFGSVLYEMLTGKRAFPGETMADIFASIIKAEPDWSLLPPNIPGSAHQLLRRCLQKDRTRRMRNIGDAAIEIDGILSQPLSDGAGKEGPSRPRRASWYIWGAALIVVLILVGMSIGLRPPPTPAPVIRFAIEPPEPFFTRGEVNRFVLSPDGRHLAFVAEGASRKLWVRSLDSSVSRPIPGTENARFLPFWSPDSRYVGFYSNNSLYKVSIGDDHVQAICTVPGFPDSTWNANNVIVTAIEGTLYRVSADGGDLQVVLAPPGSTEEVQFFAPEFLPDGNHFLYAVSSSQRDAQGVWVRSLNSGEQKRLLPFAIAARYYSGHLLYLREGKLLAQPFDIAKLSVTGEQFSITPEPGRNSSIGAFHTASTDVLAWSEKPKGAAELTWRDRFGKKTPVNLPPGLYRQVRLSPGASRAALLTSDNPGIFLLEMSSGVFSRLTSSPRSETDMVWSPDGKELAFSLRGNLFRRAIGSSDAVPFYQSPEGKWLHDWSPDGKYLVFAHDQGVYALPTTGEQKPITLLENSFSKDEFRVSPDNHWIAYNSDESGQSEVYVASFPKFDHRRQVSNSGGAVPRWRGDMKELYYLGSDGKLIAVDVRAGEVLETSAPHTLFQADIPFTTVLDQYDVTSDGQKFLIIENEAGATSPPINIVVNWAEELRTRSR